MARPEVNLKNPVHLSVKLIDGLKTIRQPVLRKKFLKAAKRAREFGLYVIHFTLQKNHIHIYAEARDKESLGSGMRCLAGTFSRAVRATVTEKIVGSVFKGRYHISLLKTPTQVKNALSYVLLNLSHHIHREPILDRYSSGLVFDDWKKLIGWRFCGEMKSEWHEARKDLSAQQPYIVLKGSLSEPQSWLAKIGWLKASPSLQL